MPDKKNKIIIVEDDPAIVGIYSMVARKDLFDIETISSGQEAIKRIKDIADGKEQKPSIMLLDLVLPDISGVDVFNEIKKNSATKDIKVFILTNQQDYQLQWPGESKPDKFLIKANTTPTQLLSIIKEELG